MHRPALLRVMATLVALWPAAGTPAAAEEELLDGIAAQVGTSVVLMSDVGRIAAPAEERLVAEGAPPAVIAQNQQRVLDSLIDQQLIQAVVTRLELTASDAEVDRAIESIAQESGITIRQLERSVTSHGLSLEEYREKIRREIERSKVLSTMVRSQVRIEPEEIEAIYLERFADQPVGGEELHLRHAVVPFGEDRQAACDLARAARERVVAGEIDFAELTREISVSNVERGGDLGWVHRDELAPALTSIADDLERGDLSPPVELGPACHLIQLVDRRKYEPVTLEQAAPEIERLLFRQKMEEEYTKWVESLREQTYVERKGVFRTGGDGNPG